MNSINWLKKFGREPLANGKNMIELFRYDDYSLWWFAEWFMEHGSFYVLNVRSFLNNPDRPNYKNKSAAYLKLISLVFRKAVWCMFSPFNHKIKNSKKTIAFVSTAMNGGKFDPLIEKLKGKYNLCFIDIPLNKEIGVKSYYKGIQKGRVLPIEAYIGLTEIKKASKKWKQYKKVWNSIKKDISMSDQRIKKHTIHNLDFFFSEYLFIILLEIEGLRTCFKKNKIDLVCTFDPFDLMSFKIKCAAKNKILGLQVGTWDAIQVHYIHSKKDLETYPLVDYLAVFDNITKKNIVKTKNIDPTKIFIVDNYKMDNLIYKIKKLDLKLTNKSILFIAQIFLDKGEEKETLKSLFEFFKKHPGEKKVIRLYPGEPNIQPYKKLIKQYRIKNIDFSSKKDIIFPLMKSKMVIGSFSTALLESIMLGKPTTIIDVHNKGYKKLFKNVKSAQNSKDLERIFSKINETHPGLNLKEKAYTNIASRIGEII